MRKVRPQPWLGLTSLLARRIPLNRLLLPLSSNCLGKFQSDSTCTSFPSWAANEAHDEGSLIRLTSRLESSSDKRMKSRPSLLTSGVSCRTQVVDYRLWGTKHLSKEINKKGKWRMKARIASWSGARQHQWRTSSQEERRRMRRETEFHIRSHFRHTVRSAFRLEVGQLDPTDQFPACKPIAHSNKQRSENREGRLYDLWIANRVWDFESLLGVKFRT